MEVVNGVKEAIKEVMPYLEQAAEKIGQTAQYLWMLQIKQGYIVGVSYLLKYVLWAAVFGLWLFFVPRVWNSYKTICENNKKKDYFNRDNATHEFCFLIGGVFLFVWFLELPSANQLLTLLFNTEYWALNETIKLLKGAVK